MKKENLKNETLNENLDEAMQEIAKNGGEPEVEQTKETPISDEQDDVLDNLTDSVPNKEVYFLKIAVKPREEELKKVAPCLYFRKKNREGKWETQKDKQGKIRFVKSFGGDVSDIDIVPYTDMETGEDKNKLQITFEKNLAGKDCLFILDTELTYPAMGMINSILSLDAPLKTLVIELYANYEGNACINTYPNGKSTPGKKGLSWKYPDAFQKIVKTKVGKKEVTDDSELKDFLSDNLINHRNVLVPNKPSRRIVPDEKPNKSDNPTEPEID